MADERVGVSYKINKKTKEKLDLLKKQHKISTTDIIDKVLAFDGEGLEFFIKIMNLLDNPNREYNFFRVSNGGLIYNKEYMDKIEAALLHQKSLKQIQIESIKYNTENEDEDEEISEGDSNLDEYIERTVKLTHLAAKFIRETENFEKRITKIEKVLKKNGINIEDI